MKKKTLGDRMGAVMMGAYVAFGLYFLSSVTLTHQKLERLHTIAETRADHNRDGAITPEEAVVAYDAIPFSGERYLSMITPWQQYSVLCDNLEGEELETFQKKAGGVGLLFQHNDYVNGVFRKFADFDDNGIVLSDEGRKAFLMAYSSDFYYSGSPSVFRFSLDFSSISSSGGETLKNIFLTPWRAGEGSELGRYVNEGK
jgi:hypothetical protein